MFTGDVTGPYLRPIGMVPKSPPTNTKRPSTSGV